MNSVCVLIATKDRRVLLERCVKSVFNQNIYPDEIIIVNDGSVDDTKNFLDSLKNEKIDIKIINRSKNSGVNIARHEGIKVAKSQWIAFLDDDDEFFPDAIKKIKEKLKEVSENQAVIFFNTILKKTGSVFNGGFIFKEGEYFHDLNYEEMMFIKSKINGDCKPVIRNKIFSEENYRFPESVNGSESYLFYILARDGKGIRCYPDITTLIHQEDELKDRLSINASRKNPWPLFVLHARQIPQHFWFYIKHPLSLLKKIKEMLKLLIRSFFKFIEF
jgi:glycosyltransferase involved in cell wall biosynthesis